MSIKKNRDLMVEQIKRLRGEVKESVNKAHRLFEATVEADAINPNDSNFLKFLKNNNIKITKKVKQKGSGVFVPPMLITMQGERSDLEKVLRKYWDGEGIDDIQESVNERAPEPEIDRSSANFQSTIRQIKGVIKQAQQLLEYVEGTGGYSDNRLSVYLNKGLITRKAKELTSATKVTSTVLNDELKTYERLYDRWYRNQSK